MKQKKKRILRLLVIIIQIQIRGHNAALLDPLDISNPDLKGRNPVYHIHASYNFGEYIGEGNFRKKKTKILKI